MKKLFIALLAFNFSIDALDAAVSQLASVPLLAAARPEGQGYEPGRRAQVPLIDAVMAEDVERVRSLLEQGANPNEVDTSGMWALLAAVIDCRIEITEILLNTGANPNFSGPDDPVPSGYEEGSIEARARRGGRPLLLEAAKNDFAEGMELLLEYGADVNQEGRDFTTPLFGAAVAGHKTPWKSSCGTRERTWNVQTSMGGGLLRSPHR